MNEIENNARELTELAIIGFKLKDEIVVVNQRLEYTQQELNKAKEDIEAFKTQYEVLKNNIKPFYFKLKQFLELIFNNETLHYFEKIFPVEPEIDKFQPLCLGNSLESMNTEQSFQLGVNFLTLVQNTIETQDPQNSLNYIYQNEERINHKIYQSNEPICIENNGQPVPSQCSSLQSIVSNSLDIYNGEELESHDSMNYDNNPVSQFHLISTFEKTNKPSKTSFVLSSERNTIFACWKTEMKKDRLTSSDKAKKYICNICKNVFKHKSGFKTHYIERHKWVL